MTLYIKHRVNSIQELKSIDARWGVEIDLRSEVGRPGKLHLSHDPWRKGDDFEKWLREFVKRGIRGPVVLNTKEDGLEEAILGFLKKYRIKNYFFLDTAFPTLVRWSIRERNPSFALRFSKYEKESGLRPFAGKADWVWADCFDGEALPKRDLLRLKKLKVCLVSPELQGKPVSEIRKFLSLKSIANAVCTKRPDLWENL